MLAETDSNIIGVYYAKQRHFEGPAAWRHAADDPLLRQAGCAAEQTFR